MVKPPYGEPAHPETVGWTIAFFDALMRIAHPFMPFITEEVWQTLAERKAGESIVIAPAIKAGQPDEILLSQAALAFELIAGVRNARSARGHSPKETLNIEALVTDSTPYNRFGEVIGKLANVEIAYVKKRPERPSDLIAVKQDAFFSILAIGKVDMAAERENLLKDLEYQKGFLASVETKLSNEKFVANAKPDMVERERQKKADAEAKIATIEQAIAAL
jgi:valyl-tRNA synthetase